MNIFYLDENPAKACRYLMDVHVRKMTLETCQLLMTTDILHGYSRPWKPTHMNHPCRVALEDNNNYIWLCHYFREICNEFYFRFGKQHRCVTFQFMLYTMTEDYSPPHFPQCMPEEFRRDNCVEAYREYYKSKYKEFSERGIAKYTNRGVPEWLLIKG